MHLGRTEPEICAAAFSHQRESLLDAVDPASVPPEHWSDLVRLDPILQCGLSLAPEDRWPTALALSEALVAAVPPAPPAEVARWVKRLGKEYLEGRERIIVTEESTWRQLASLPELDGSLRDGHAEGETGTLRPSALASTSGVPPRRSRPPPLHLHRRLDRAIAAGLIVVAGLLGAILLVVARRPEEPAAASRPSVGDGGISRAAPTPAYPPGDDGAPSAGEVRAALQPPASTTPLGPATASSLAVLADAAPVHEASAPPSDAGVDAPLHPARPRPAPSSTGSVPAPPATPRGIASAPVDSGANNAEGAGALRRGPAATAATSDCDPPFFYEGRKKVFKPGCL
jgi:serine/threonine-protein kinase